MKILIWKTFICVHLIKCNEVVISIPETDGYGTGLLDTETRIFWTSEFADWVADTNTSLDTDTGSDTHMFYNDINFENLSNLGYDIVDFGDHNMTVSFHFNPFLGIFYT